MAHNRGHLWTLSGTLALLALLAFAIGPRAAAAQNGASVSIVDFAFQPASVEVAAGSTVTWTNSGAAPHTVTADNGAFDSGQLAPGASFSQTFDTAGTFTYHCEIHPQMTATITVTGGGGGGNQPAPAPAQTTQVPRTGVGTAADGLGTTPALLFAIAAIFMATGARLARRSA
jgi:plastocyanin